MECKILNVKQLPSALQISFDSGKTITFEDCWLRDQCRCSLCYHADKYQRAVHLLQIPDAKIVGLQFNYDEIVLQWSDGHANSKYSSNFLIQFDYKSWKSNRTLKPILWRGPKVAEKIARVPVHEFLNSVGGARRVFQSLLNYGVSLIEGVDPTVSATESVCKALGGVQRTLFGDMWEFTNNADHADTAYTNLPLAVHNDNTYFTQAAGLQVLHCIKHLNPKGGETILVDGFYGATQLKEESPNDFDFLTTFDVEAEYIEEGHHYTYSAPVIQVDRKTYDIQQIRYNVYDRSPMAFKSGDECRNYYRSLRNLGLYYDDPENQWQFKLSPGVVMVMDNFRILHGRTSFSGHRVLCGSYVSRSDWLDRARTLGLIQ